MLDSIRRDVADRRDQILFGENFNRAKYPGGIRHFNDLTTLQVNQLKDLGLLDLNDSQNDSPTMGEMIDFLKARETDGWYVIGYCVSPERSDFRVTFEGIGKSTPPSKQDIIDFTTLFRWADEFYVNNEGLRCWYD